MVQYLHFRILEFPMIWVFGAADVSGSEDSQAFGKKNTPGTVGVVHAELPCLGLGFRYYNALWSFFLNIELRYYKYTLLIYP